MRRRGHSCAARRPYAYPISGYHLFIKSVDFLQLFRRWRATRAALLRDLERQRSQIESLQSRIGTLQSAKDRAEQDAKERRREKESLRSRVTSQKRQLDDYERQIETLNAKVIELRETIQTLEKKR